MNLAPSPASHTAPAAGGQPGLHQRARGLVCRVMQASPLLSRVGFGLLVASAFSATLILLDARSFNGVSTWLKPWKFQFSLALQLLTLALYMQALAPAAQRSRAVRLWSWVTAVTALFEAGYITIMGALGQASHFNVSTAFTAALYSLMGVGAVLLSLSGGMIGVLIARHPREGLAPALRWGLALALLLGWLLGSATGGYMSAQPGHWVGGTLSDAGGLWLFGWSRDGGDLRVAHFFGLHAMQGVALVAWWCSRSARNTGAHRQALIVTLAAATGWTTLAAFTFWQAVHGLPLLPH